MTCKAHFLTLLWENVSMAWLKKNSIKYFWGGMEWIIKVLFSLVPKTLIVLFLMSHSDAVGTDVRKNGPSADKSDDVCRLWHLGDRYKIFVLEECTLLYLRFFSLLQAERYMPFLCSLIPAPLSSPLSGTVYCRLQSWSIITLICFLRSTDYCAIRFYNVSVVLWHCRRLHLPDSSPSVHTLRPDDISAVHVLGVPPSHR